MSKNKYPLKTIIDCCSKYRTGESVANIAKRLIFSVPLTFLFFNNSAMPADAV